MDEYKNQCNKLKSVTYFKIKNLENLLFMNIIFK